MFRYGIGASLGVDRSCWPRMWIYPWLGRRGVGDRVKRREAIGEWETCGMSVKGDRAGKPGCGRVCSCQAAFPTLRRMQARVLSWTGRIWWIVSSGKRRSEFGHQVSGGSALDWMRRCL